MKLMEFLIILIVIVLFFSVGACHDLKNNNSSAEKVPVNPSGQTNASIPAKQLPDFGPQVLQFYTSCSELDEDLELLAQTQIDMYLDFIIYYRHRVEEEIFFPHYTTHSGITPSALPLHSTGDYGTNNRVLGVEEADYIKSDGKYVFLVFGNEIIVHDLNGQLIDRVSNNSINTSVQEIVSNAPTLGDFSYDSIDFSGVEVKQIQYIHGLLIHRNRLLSIASSQESISKDNFNLSFTSTPLRIYEISPAGKLNLLETIILPGHFVDIGLKDDQVDLIYSNYLENWTLTTGIIKNVKDYSSLSDEELRILLQSNARFKIPAWKTKIYQNMFNLKPSQLSQTQCQTLTKINTGITQQFDVPLNSKQQLPYFFPNQIYINQMFHINSFQLSHGFNSLRQTLVGTHGSSSVKRMNEDTVIVAGTGWELQKNDLWQKNTLLIEFNLKQGQALPNRFGSVPGKLPNSNTLDIHNNHLRLVTYNDSKWSQSKLGNWIESNPATSQLTILQLTSQKMQKTGELTELGKKENIFTVHLDQDRGYVMSRGPMTTLNLTNPQDPKIEGVLKLSEANAYLYRIDKDTLLTVEQNYDRANYFEREVLITLFDTQEFANPYPIQQLIHAGGFLEPFGNFKSYRVTISGNYLILPRTEADLGFFYNSFDIYSVNRTTGIIFKGKIQHARYRQTPSCLYFNSPISRSFVFENQWVTFNGLSVKSHNLIDFTKNWEIQLECP